MNNVLGNKKEEATTMNNKTKLPTTNHPNPLQSTTITKKAYGEINSQNIKEIKNKSFKDSCSSTSPETETRRNVLPH